MKYWPCGSPARRPSRSDDLRRARTLPGRAVDRAAVEHRLQDDVAARDRALEVDGRRVARRRLHQAGEQRGFRHRQLRRRLAEVTARRCLDAVQTVAEVDLVQIQLEDFVLGERALEPPREDQFLQLPADGLVRRQEALPRELLRDRAAALRGAAVAKVGDRRSRHAADVEAAVIVEPLIFDGEDRVDEVRRNV